MGVNNASLLEEIRKTKRDLAQAHSSFISHYNAFLALSDQLEDKFKELDVRETTVEIREQELQGQRQQVQERERKCFEREQALEAREKEVATKPNPWNDPELRMRQNTVKLPSTVSATVPKANEVPEAAKAWLPNKTFQLVYKASVDGFGAKDFHRLCDDKGPTLSLIRSSNGYLFGGYSRIPWNSSNDFKQSDKEEDTFIFTITNPHNIPPTKYQCCDQQYAICCNSDFGPTFGTGHDIYVSDNSHQNNSSYTTFPDSYIDSTGKGGNTFTGAKNFTSSEIEVYSVI